jgi:hypothetical protein
MRIILNNFQEEDVGTIYSMIKDMVKNKYKTCIYTFSGNRAFFAKETKSGISITKEV